MVRLMTDWNKELDLLKEYIDWRVDSFSPAPLGLTYTGATAFTPEQIFKWYREMGVLFVNCEPQPSIQLLSFEQWKEKIWKNN